MSGNKYPKVLIISHNSFSYSGSNGRTLAGFFEGYPIENIAQLYIVDENPNHAVCNNYFRVTDRDVLYSTMRFQSAGQSCENVAELTLESPGGVSRRRTAMLLAREWLWGNPFWKRGKIYEWIETFQPEVVLLQAGNLGFLCQFAAKISKRYQIPLVVYNSEGYYLKKYDYIKETLKKSFFFDWYSSVFRRRFRKMMKQAKHVVYISEDLEKAYGEFFDTPSSYIMTAANSYVDTLTKGDGTVCVSYLGNLDLGRHKSLIEVASALTLIVPSVRLHVYGKSAKKEVVEELKACPAICYHGFVSYDEVLKIIHESTVNVHVEGFEKFFVEDSKYAFSTKIADLLAAGRAIFMYAPENLTSSKYIKENECGSVVSNLKETTPALKKILFNEEYRNKIQQNGLNIARLNHDLKKNTERFQNIIREAVNDYEGSSN